MRAFTLLDRFTRSLPPHSAVFPRSWFSFPPWTSLLLCDSSTESHISSHWPSALRYQSLASLAKIPGHLWHLSQHNCLISRIFTHFQDLPCSQDLHLPFSRSPLPLFSETNSFWHQLYFLGCHTSHFPSLKSLCSEVQCDYPSNWWFCLMFSCKLEDPRCVILFNLSIIRIYNQGTAAAATK